MAPDSQSKFDQQVDQYFEKDHNPQFLYQGSHEDIIEKLKAWIVRRKVAYKEQMELRERSQKASKEIFDFPEKVMEPGYMNVILARYDRVTVRSIFSTSRR